MAGIRSTNPAMILLASAWAWRSACSCSRSVAISSAVRSSCGPGPVGWSAAPGRLVGCARAVPPKTTNTRPPSRTVASVPRLMRLLTASALIPNAAAVSGTVSLRPGAWPVAWSVGCPVGPGRPWSACTVLSHARRVHTPPARPALAVRRHPLAPGVVPLARPPTRRPHLQHPRDRGGARSRSKRRGTSPEPSPAESRPAPESGPERPESGPWWRRIFGP